MGTASAHDLASSRLVVRKEGGLDPHIPVGRVFVGNFEISQNEISSIEANICPCLLYAQKHSDSFTLKIHLLWPVECNCSAGAVISCTSKVSSGFETGVDIQKCPLETAITGCFD
jgi:hypothetical protein